MPGHGGKAQAPEVRTGKVCLWPGWEPIVLPTRPLLFPGPPAMFCGGRRLGTGHWERAGENGGAPLCESGRACILSTREHVVEERSSELISETSQRHVLGPG